MPNGHRHSAGASITYGEAGVLFPVTEVQATVKQYREAELALDDVTGNDVIVVSPTSLASGYALGQHPLTAIVIETLPTSVQTQIDAAIDGSINDFDLIQIGQWNADTPNHSLAEFGEI